MPKMVKVYRMPIHDCPKQGRKIPVMQLRAYREERFCCCEHCFEVVAHFERRESVEEIFEGA